MANNASQGIYLPLPQSLSDSDSEKEMSVDVLRPKFVNRQTQNGTHENFHLNGNTTALQMSEIPEITKLQPSMSAARKCCFIASILLCFMTIIVFLWVLPCSESGTCPVKISNWENQHDGIELTGKINVVESAFKHTLNLALLFKHSLNSAESQSGAISVLGSNGAVAWYIPLIQTPTDLNCYLIDVNGDDITDCLLLGKMGLKAVDPVSGTIFWHVHTHQFQSKIIADLDFPVVIPDINNDGINEILTSSNPSSDQVFSMMLIISGKTGMVLSQFSVKLCYDVHILRVDGSNIIYSCKNETELSYYRITLQQLSIRVFNKTFKVEPIKSNYVSLPESPYIVNGRQLIVNNIGVCPNNNCRAHISLLDEQSNKEIVSWSYSNSYAMKPTSFSFQQTKSNLASLKGHVNGYILKLWQWSDYKGKNKKQMHPELNENNYIRNSNTRKRNIPTNNNTLQINSIMERIVLITFNDSNVHVINASLTEVTQLCFPLADNLFSCQPDLCNQNDSLLISDLDMDGSQELISYSSSYVSKEDSNKLKESWQLISNMKVIRLEAELPKLYEAAK